MRNKKIGYTLCLCWLLVVGCSPTTTITLNLRNVPAGEFLAVLPTDGGASVVVLDTIRWRGDTTIVLSIQADGRPTSFALWGSKGLASVRSVCGTEDFSITIDPTDSLSVVRFEGPNAAGRALLQRLSETRNVYQYELVRDFSRAPLDTVAEQMQGHFAALLAADRALFDSLGAAGAIDADFYAYALLDAQVFYTLSLGKVLYADFYNTRYQPKKMRAGYGALWDRLYVALPVSEAVYRTSSGVAYADCWANRYMAYRDALRDTVPPTFNTQQAYRTHLLGRADLFDDQELRRLYLGATLASECVNNKTSDTTLVAELERYAQSYPTSRLNGYFARHRVEWADYYRRLAQADTTQIHWVPRSDSMHTFAEVLAAFKGKPLFIDFWFSTCSPCIAEMKQSGALQAFLQAAGIELLYISIDPPQRAVHWSNTINSYRLYGHHLRTSKALHEDLEKNYGIVLFPTYMLVDASGRVVVDRARNPSEGQALLDQIASAL